MGLCYQLDVETEGNKEETEITPQFLTQTMNICFQIAWYLYQLKQQQVVNRIKITGGWVRLGLLSQKGKWTQYNGSLDREKSQGFLHSDLGPFKAPLDRLKN